MTLPGEIEATVGAGFTAGVGGGVVVVGGGVVLVAGLEPPLQPESKERERAEPTKSRKLRRTNPPKVKQVVPENDQ